MAGSRTHHRRLLAAFTSAASASAMVVVFAFPAAAAPPPVTSGAVGLPEPTAGVQSITAPDGDMFFFLPVDRGRRWFPFCPNGDPPDQASDVCGGTGAGDKVYGGRTFFPDPGDARCTVVAAHNETVHPSDVVLPRKCYRLPLMFGVAGAAMLDSVAETMRQSVGSCAGVPGPGQPARTVEQCANPLTRWPRQGSTGPVDCTELPVRSLPPEVAAYTASGQDPARLREVCAVLDAYLTTPTTPGTSGVPGAGGAGVPPTAAALALGSAGFDLYARGTGRAPTQRLLDLGLFTLNLTEACANGNTVACGLDKAAAALDCASDAMGCLSRWLADGATSAVRLLGEVIAAPPAVDLTDPAFRSVYQPLGVTSAYVALLLLLISGITSTVRLDYAGLGTAVLGVFKYALGLTVLLTLTVTALDLAHALSVGIAGDQASLQALTTRFQQAIQGGLAGEGSSAPTAFVAVLAVLVLLAAAFTWVIMYGRKAAILIICAFSPILLAGQAGPAWARAWAPRAVKMLTAIIFAQPVAAVFYRLGVGLMALSPGPGNVVTGVIILLLVGFSPWLLLAFIGLTTQMLAGEQTRARGGHGGAGLTAAAMAAATMRANAPRAALATATPTAPTGPAAGSAVGGAATGGGAWPGIGGSGGGGASRGGFGRLAATGVLMASVAQQLGAHVGEQVTTGGGATGEAPRGPQLAHAASIGAHRAPAAPAVASPPRNPPSGPGAAAGPVGFTDPGPPPLPSRPSPSVPAPPPPPEPDPEPLAPAAARGWAVPR